MESTPDWIAIVIAAILNMAIGYVWYSRWLFGPAWLKLSDMTEKKAKPSGVTIALACIVSLIIAYFLDFFQRQLGISTVSDGMFFGFCAWLGFVATAQIASVLWCKKPWKLFIINTGCKLLTFLVMSGVIAA